MVYLICLDKPYRRARHYIGYSKNPLTESKIRIMEYSIGSGSRFMAAIAKQGIDFSVTRTWPDGDRYFQRKLQNRKKSSDLCPHCVAEKKLAKQKALLNRSDQDKELVKDTMISQLIQSFDGIEDLAPFEPARDNDFIQKDEIAQEVMDKEKEAQNAESSSPVSVGGRQRVWSRLAGLWLVLKNKFVSKR